MKIKLTLDDISEMSIEELREEVERLDAESEQRKKDHELKLERLREKWGQNSYGLEKSSNTRTESTNDSAQNVSFPSETNRNSQVHDTPKDCLEEIDESVFLCMFDESVHSNSDSVSHAELINFSCDTQEEDGHESDLCLMFEESYESVQVVSGSLSVDFSEIQFHAYDDDCTKVL